MAHEAIGRRDADSIDHVAIARVEQLYPWPAAEIDRVLQGYPNVTEVVVAQEEPENMGAWPFVHLQMHHQFRGTRGLARRPRGIG